MLASETLNKSAGHGWRQLIKANNYDLVKLNVSNSKLEETNVELKQRISRIEIIAVSNSAVMTVELASASVFSSYFLHKNLIRGRFSIS